MTKKNIPWRKIADWAAWYLVYLGCFWITWWLGSPETTVGQQANAIMAGWFIASVLYGICLWFRPAKKRWKYTCNHCDFRASGNGDLDDMYTIMLSHTATHTPDSAPHA